MYLTPEDQAVGKENFEHAIGYTRREFLMGTVAAGVMSGAGLGAMYFKYGTSVPNPVRVAFIGTGDEGSVLIGAHTPSYLQCVAIADIRSFNIHRAFHGDYSSDNALKVRPGLMAKYGWSSEDEARRNVRVYGDYNELLKNAKEDGVEAVVIALPLHLHAEASIKAMRAGLHVLTEKLMAHNVAQCKEMGRVAKETGLYLATGHQRHYSILYDNAIHTIKNGLLGDLHHIRAQWHRNNLPGNDSWQPPVPLEGSKDFTALSNRVKSLAKKVKEAEKANDFVEAERQRKLLAQTQMQLKDADLKAENYGYQFKELPGGYQRSALEELIRWRIWERTGGGLMAELGSHQLDAAGIFCTAMRRDGQKALPLTVNATGGRHIFPMDRECEDHVYCMYEYPQPEYHPQENPEKKIVVTYSSINGNGFGDYGECVMGTKRTLVLLREQDSMLFDNKAGTSAKIKLTKNDLLDTTQSGGAAAAAVGNLALNQGPISRGYTEELEHWAWCIRNPDSENQPRCHPKVALADAVIALTTNIALRDPQHARIEFRKEWFDIDRDETPEYEYAQDKVLAAKLYKPDVNRTEYKLS